MAVLVTCKNDEDLIINEGASSQHYTAIFQMLKGQITPDSVVVCGRNLNSSKHSSMSSSPARMKMIQSKMKGLDRSQHFSHYKSMEIFPDAQGQLTLQSLVGISNLS